MQSTTEVLLTSSVNSCGTPPRYTTVLSPVSASTRARSSAAVSFENTVFSGSLMSSAMIVFFSVAAAASGGSRRSMCLKSGYIRLLQALS